MEAPILMDALGRDNLICPPPEDGNRSSFRNVVFSSHLYFRIKYKVPKPSDSE
jgi:hypothetical protein